MNQIWSRKKTRPMLSPTVQKTEQGTGQGMHQEEEENKNKS